MNLIKFTNLGFQYSWVQKYFKTKDDFWISDHRLGSKMIENLKKFLVASNIVDDKKKMFSSFGRVIDQLGLDSQAAWGLIVCNLAYKSQFNWWIKNLEFERSYTPDELFAMLGDDSPHNKRNMVDGFKKIFETNEILGKKLGLGHCEIETHRQTTSAKSFVRTSWQSPDSRVFLYSLYKFAEACGGYYQFTLTRLLDFSVESKGISPAQIFGLSRETLQPLLIGLGINYPDFIQVGFTLDLDTITLNASKTSADVLGLF